MHSDAKGGESRGRDFVVTLSVLFALLFTPVLASTQKPQTIVRLGSFSKAVDYAPYLVAKHNQLFEAALKPYNARPTYQEFQSLPTINEAFASNKLDAVLEAEAPCIVGRAAGIDIKIVGLSAVLTLPIIVRKDSHIDKVENLRGKKIAVLAGTSAHYVLLQVLEKAGLHKSDVSILDMIPPDAKSAFDSNKIDAWAIWPPFVEQEEIAGLGVPIPKATGKVVVVMAQRQAFMKENPEISKALISVLSSARQWVSEHPKETQQIVSDELKVPLAVIQRSWPRQDWLSQIDPSLLKDLQNKADFLQSVGFVRRHVDVNDLVLNSTSK